MAHQEVLNRTAKPTQQPNGVLEGVSSFTSDLATLAVLQARLAACDLRDGLKQATPALIALVIAGLVLASGIVAIVLGAAFWLASAFELQVGLAMILVGLAGLIASAVILVLSVRALTARAAFFQRSHEELERNLAWVKTTLKYSGR